MAIAVPHVHGPCCFPTVTLFGLSLFVTSFRPSLRFPGMPAQRSILLNLILVAVFVAASSSRNARTLNFEETDVASTGMQSNQVGEKLNGSSI